MRALLLVALFVPALGWAQVRVIPPDPDYTGPRMVERAEQQQHDFETRAWIAEQRSREQERENRITPRGWGDADDGGDDADD